MHIRKSAALFYCMAIVIVWAALPSPLSGAEKRTAPIAVVNGVEIPIEDYYSELNRVQRAVVTSGKSLTCAEVNRLRSEVAEGLVRRELLYQESRRKVQVGEAEINEEIKKVRDQYASETDFSNALSVMKMTLASLRAQVERGLAMQKAVDAQFTAKAVVTDQEVRAYYDRNRDSFREPEQVRASHILIKTDRAWSEARKTEARKKLAGIKSRISRGQDFASLARADSEDGTSASKGGDVGYVRRGQVLKPFEDALFALKVGEVSDIVETPIGYHLIKATERKPETTAPFEDVKEKLRAALKAEKGRQDAIAYIVKVRETAKVQISLPVE